jgi:nucleoside-diphosphate-sugar epimerase
MAEAKLRIGITGASGFIGKHLTDALQQTAGAEIRSIRLRVDGSANSGELARFVSGLDCVYHLAGVNRGADEDILRGNVLTTLRLLESLRAHGKPTVRLVFASSAQVYKPGGPRGPLRESARIEPESLYGVSKRAAEELIRLAGLDAVILRLANVYGPGCRPYYNSVVATFCARAARREPLTLHGDGRQGRDFVYITDVVRALMLTATRPAKKKAVTVFNVASGKIVSLQRIVREIRNCLPDTVVETLPQTSGGGPSYCCDPAKLRAWCGWSAKTSVGVGIGAVLQAFRGTHKDSP